MGFMHGHAPGPLAFDGRLLVTQTGECTRTHHERHMRLERPFPLHHFAHMKSNLRAKGKGAKGERGKGLSLKEYYGTLSSYKLEVSTVRVIDGG